MAEKGRQWTDCETKLLLELWSEEGIQRQLQGATRNDAIFRRIGQNLAKSVFQRTVAQIRAKIKVKAQRDRRCTVVVISRSVARALTTAPNSSSCVR